MATLLSALQTLLVQNRSGSGPGTYTYSLSPTTLGSAAFTTNLFPFLQTYLLGSAAQSLQISSATDVSAPDDLHLTLSGTCTVLGMTNASIAVTFVNTAGDAATDPSLARAVAIQLAITPPANYRLTDSFSILSNTLFGNSGFVLTTPVFLVTSSTYTDSIRNLQIEYGLSLSGQVALSGPLAGVATLTGASGAQPCYGPIGFTTDLTSRVPLLQLRLTTTFPYQLSPFSLALSIGLGTQYVASGQLTAAITASAPLTIGALDPVTIAGPVTPDGTVALDYVFAAPRTIQWQDVNLWGNATSPATAVPASLRAGAPAISRVHLDVQGAPLAVSADVWVQPAGTWAVPGTARTLAGITAHLAMPSAGTVGATLAGALGIGTGKVAVLSSASTTAFAPPFTLSLDPDPPASPQPAPPPPTASAALADAYPAWSSALPTPIANLGAAIAITEYTVAVTAGPVAATTAAFVPTASTAAWPVLANGIALALTSLDVRAVGGGNPRAVIGGTATLGTLPVIVSAAVIGSDFSQYAFAFESAAALPTVTSLAAQFVLSTSMPAGIAAIGSSYTLGTVAITLPASPTVANTVAIQLASTTAWTGWTIVKGQTYTGTVAAAGVAFAAQQTGTAAASSSGTITGAIDLAGQRAPFTLALPTSQTTLTANVTTSADFTVDALTQALLGASAVTPGWLANSQLQAGPATVDYSTAQALTATALPITGAIDIGDGSNLTGAAMCAATTSTVTTLYISATRNSGGVATAGFLFYPYKVFQFTKDQPYGVAIPAPATPPSNPQTLSTLIVIAAGIAVAGPFLVWGGVVLYNFYVCGYAPAGFGPNPTVTTLLANAFFTVARNRSYQVVAVFALFAGQLAVMWKFSNRDIATGLASQPEATPANVATALKQGITTLSAEQVTDAVTAAYPSATPQTMAGALQAAGFSAVDAAPALNAAFGSATATPAQMATLLAGAYSGLDAPTLTDALAACGYPVADVAPVLRTTFPATAGTVAQLTTLLTAAYGAALTSTALAAALELCGFSLLAITPSIVAAFPQRTLNQLAVDVVTPYAATAPASAMQLGSALAAAGASANAASPAITAALPQTSSGELSAVRSAAFGADAQTARTTGLAQQAAGATPVAAAAAIVAAAPALTATALAGALYTVYTPPSLTANALVAATYAGLPAATPVSAAAALVAAVAPNQITATQVAVALVAAQPALTAVNCARALKASDYDMADAQAALLAAGYSASVTQAAIAQVYLAGIVQAGLVTTYAGDLSVPANLQALVAAGWLLCDGASYPVSQYPDLYDAILNAHGGTATAFNVPDLRDRWLRGTNGTATYGTRPADPDTDSRTAAQAGGATGNNVGSLEAFATALPRTAWVLSTDPGHTHDFAHLTGAQDEVWSGSSDTMARNPNNTVATSGAGGHSHTFVPGGGDVETAPINRALYWIIKATET